MPVATSSLYIAERWSGSRYVGCCGVGLCCDPLLFSRRILHMYTAATAFLEALQDSGVSYIFANLGSDHPALIESLADANACGPPVNVPAANWRSLSPAALALGDVAQIAGELINARRPIVITSYLGRNPEAVRELVRFCQRSGAAVLESVPSYVNYPAIDPLYQG